MPTATYTPLANITLANSTNASVTFSSIPATYRDLVVIVNAIASVSNIQARFRLNGDTGTNYSYVRMSGNGTTATSVGITALSLGQLSAIAAATTTGALQIKMDILDYTQTNKHKTIISRADQPANATEAFSNRWASTAAVTSVTILTNSGNWAIGSTFALYGIAG